MRNSKTFANRVAKKTKFVYDGRVRKVFLGIFLFFIITLLFSNMPLRAQVPSCTITVSPKTGFLNETKFSASGTIDIPPNQQVSRIGIVDESKNIYMRYIDPTTLTKNSFSVNEFGPFSNEGKYRLDLIVSRSPGGPIPLCRSSTIEIVFLPTPTPGGPSITPTAPYTCNPPGRISNELSECADSNCRPGHVVQGVTVNSPCEPFGVIAPTTPPTPTPTPISPLPPCAEWEGLNKDGQYVSISAKDIDSFKDKKGEVEAARNNLKCISINTAIGEISTEPQGFVKRIFSFVLGIAGGIALILIIISGYRMMASQGNPEALTAARDQLTSAIVGLLFIIFSFVILEVIGVDILKIPGFGK